MRDPAVVLASSSVYPDQLVKTDGIHGVKADSIHGFPIWKPEKMGDQLWSIVRLKLEIDLEPY